MTHRVEMGSELGPNIEPLSRVDVYIRSIDARSEFKPVSGDEIIDELGSKLELGELDIVEVSEISVRLGLVSAEE